MAERSLKTLKCIFTSHDCLFLNLDRSMLWYAVQQLSSDFCTYLRSLDKAFLTMECLFLDDDLVRFILDDQYPQFRSICMSRIHGMRSKVSRRDLGSINRH